MHNINTHKTGLVLGSLVGVIHLVWSILVAIGLAQSLVDFIFKLHMVRPIIVVDTFSIGLAVALIIVTAIIGYIVGYIFALIWNKLHK